MKTLALHILLDHRRMVFGRLHVLASGMEGASVVETHPEAALEAAEDVPDKDPVWVVPEVLSPSLPTCRQGRADPLQLRVLQGDFPAILPIEPEEVLSIAVRTCTYDRQRVCPSIKTPVTVPNPVLNPTTLRLCNPIAACLAHWPSIILTESLLPLENHNTDDKNKKWARTWVYIINVSSF